MGNIRQLIRKTSAALLTLLLVLVVGGLATEWVIELAREWGFFLTPTQRAGQAVSIVWSFVTQTWFLVSGALLVGLTLGVWIDYLLRLRELGSKAHLHPHYEYQQKILAIAKGLRDNKVSGRMQTVINAAAKKQYSHFVNKISGERVRCEGLMNADVERLTARQANLITQYRLDENELETFLNQLKDRNYTEEKTINSFFHRLRNLSATVNKLIDDWYKDGFA